MQSNMNSNDIKKEDVWSKINLVALAPSSQNEMTAAGEALFLEAIGTISQLNSSFRSDQAAFLQVDASKLMVLFQNKAVFCNDRIYEAEPFVELISCLVNLLVTEPHKDLALKHNLLREMKFLDLKRLKENQINLSAAQLSEFLERSNGSSSGNMLASKELFKEILSFLKPFAKHWNNDPEIIKIILNAKLKSLSQRFELMGNLLKIKFLNQGNFQSIQNFASKFSYNQLLDQGYFLENFVSNSHLNVLPEELLALTESKFQELFGSPEGLRRSSPGMKPFKAHRALISLIVAMITKHHLVEEVKRKLADMILHILKLFKSLLSKKGQNQEKSHKILFLEIYHWTLKKFISKIKPANDSSSLQKQIEADMKQFAYEFFLFLIPLNVAEEPTFKDCMLLMKKAYGEEFKVFVQRKVLLINEKDEIKKEILINFMAKTGFLLWDIDDETFFKQFEEKIAFLLSKEKNPINEKIHEYFFARACFYAQHTSNGEKGEAARQKVMHYFTLIFANNYMIHYRINYKLLSSLNLQLNGSEFSQLLEMALGCCLNYEGEINFEGDNYYWPTLKSLFSVLYRLQPDVMTEYATNIIANLVIKEKIDENIFKENFKTKEVKVFLKLALSIPTKVLKTKDCFAELYYLFSHLLSITNISWVPMYKAMAKKVVKLCSSMQNVDTLNSDLRKMLRNAVAIVTSNLIQQKRSEFISSYSLLNYLLYGAESVVSPLNEDVVLAVSELNKQVFAFLQANQTFDSYIGSVLAMAYAPVQFEDQISKFMKGVFEGQLKFIRKYPNLLLEDRPRAFQIVDTLRKNMKINRTLLLDRQAKFIYDNYPINNAYFSFFNSKYKISDINFIIGLTKFLKRGGLDYSQGNEVYRHLIQTLLNDFDAITDLNDIEESYIQLLRNLLDNPFYIDPQSLFSLIELAKKVFSSKFSLEAKGHFLMLFTQFALSFFGFVKAPAQLPTMDIESTNQSSAFAVVVDNISSFIINGNNIENLQQKLENMISDGSILDNFTKKVMLVIFLQIAKMSKWNRLTTQLEPAEVGQILVREIETEFPTFNMIFNDVPGDVRAYNFSSSSSFDVTVSETFFIKLLEKIKEDIEHKTGSVTAQFYMNVAKSSGSFGFKKFARSLSHFAILENILAVANEPSLLKFLQIYNNKVVAKEDTEVLRIVISSLVFKLMNKGFLLNSFNDLVYDFFAFMSKNFKVKQFEPFVVFTGNVFRPKLLNLHFVTHLTQRLLKSTSNNQILLLSYLIQYFKAYPLTKIVSECISRLEKIKTLDSHQSYFIIITIAQLLENYYTIKKLFDGTDSNNWTSSLASHINIENYKKLISTLANMVEINTTNQDYILLLFGRIERYQKDGFLHEMIALLFEKIIKFLEDASIDKTSKTTFLDSYQQKIGFKIDILDSRRYIEYLLDKMDKVQTNFSEQFLIIVYLKIVFNSTDLKIFQESFGRVIRGRSFAVKQRAEDALRKATANLPSSILIQFPVTFNILRQSLDPKDSVLLLNAFLPTLHTNVFLVNDFFAVTRALVSESQDDSLKTRLKSTLNEFYYLKGRFLNLEEYVLDKELIDRLVDFSENISYFT